MSMEVRKRGLIEAVSEQLPEHITPEEVYRIFYEAEKEGNKRDYLFIKVLWMAGLRISEAVNITPRHIEIGGLHVWGKSRPRTKEEMEKGIPKHPKRDRIVQIHPDLKHLLVDYIFDNEIEKDKRIFSFATARGWQIVQHYVKKAGISRKIWPHMFRHGFAVNYLHQTNNIRALQDMLGHSSLNTTMIYTKLTDKDKQELVNRVQF